MDELADAADDLYTLTPEQFTAARNERAKQLGDPVLAARVRELRKPSPAAWVVNALVRKRRHEIDEVLELGASLREAQEDLDRAELAALTKQRRQLVTALAKQGAQLAESAGHRVSASVVEEVAQTLQAAMTDAAASDAILTGRLVRSLTAVGFDPVDLDGAVAGGPAPVRVAKPAKRDDAARQALENARGDAAEAERKAADAASARDDVDRRMVRLGQRREQLDDERADLEEQLRAVRADIAAAEREARALDKEHDRATRNADEARAAADAAQERVERLA